MKTRVKAGRVLVALAGLLSILAIAFLTWTISTKIRELGSANSDNVEWSLSQAEVEFLEFSSRVRLGNDLPGLRRRFDVFYSRIGTIAGAQVFEELRADPVFFATLETVQLWLDDAVPIIDSSDVELTTKMPLLFVQANDIRPEVRKLSNSGLSTFARNADDKRQEIVSTMIELAIALAGLIAVLWLAVLYLIRLNTRLSQRERAERLISARMNTVMNTSLDGVIVSNAQGEIVQFSPAAEAIFGFKADDVIGLSIGDVIVPDSMRQAHETGMERMRRNGEKRVVGKGRVRLEGKRADGSIFPVELALQSATAESNEIFVAFMRDLTQVVADEAELVDARDKAIAGEKSRAEFLATMSHEIRTPLNGLLGHVALLRDTPLSAKQDKYLRNMETSGRLLMSHVSDVLDISRYDAGKITATLEPVNISALLQDIIDSQSGMAAAQETVLKWGWDGPPQHWVKSDKDRLQHILMNLVGNALKFTKRGRVTVTVNWHNGEMVIDIEDTGTGIPETLQPHIFDDFVTGNTSYDRDAGGSGLGLSIAKRFVTVLNGDISFDSEPGVGTTFRVTLGAKAVEAVAEQALSRDEPEKIQALKILVVEDNEINRFVAREMLVADGHIVAEAHDGQQGVEMAAAELFDLILMDISMPVLDGKSATRKIREGSGSSAATRIVALTANALPEERQDFLSHGMNDVLTKPLTKSELRRILSASVSVEPPSEIDLIDLAHGTETLEVIGAEAYIKIFERFKMEMDGFLEWVQSEATRDRNDIAAQAHKIAGNAALFGAVSLRQALLKLEQDAKAGKDQDLVTGISELPDLWRRSKQALAATSGMP